MSNPLLAKSYVAEVAIPAGTIVKPGVAGGVVPATSAGDSLVAISSELSVVAGERVDIVGVGITYVIAGAAFAVGAMLTSDGSGRAVASAAGNRIIAMALESASVAGDQVRVLLSHGVH